MANEDFHIGAAGSVLHLTFKKQGVPFDISQCIHKYILLKRKSVDVIQREAQFETDGTDGKIKYVFTAEDLSVVGEWSAQGFVYFSQYSIVYSSTITFTVAANLKEAVIS